MLRNLRDGALLREACTAARLTIGRNIAGVLSPETKGNGAAERDGYRNEDDGSITNQKSGSCATLWLVHNALATRQSNLSSACCHRTVVRMSCDLQIFLLKQQHARQACRRVSC